MRHRSMGGRHRRSMGRREECRRVCGRKEDLENKRVRKGNKRKEKGWRKEETYSIEDDFGSHILRCPTEGPRLPARPYVLGEPKVNLNVTEVPM